MHLQQMGGQQPNVSHSYVPPIQAPSPKYLIDMDMIPVPDLPAFNDTTFSQKKSKNGSLVCAMMSATVSSFSSSSGNSSTANNEETQDGGELSTTDSSAAASGFLGQ